LRRCFATYIIGVESECLLEVWDFPELELVSLRGARRRSNLGVAQCGQMSEQIAAPSRRPARRMARNDTGLRRCRTSTCRESGDVLQFQNPPESPFAKGGLRGIGGQGVEIGFVQRVLWTPLLDSRLRGNDTGTSAWVCRGAKPLCRGFGGVPQSSFLFPLEWGIKGVDRT